MEEADVIPFLSRIPWRMAGLVALTAGAFLTGWKAQDWRRDSMELVALEAADRAALASREAIVSAVNGLRPKYVTINRAVERETRVEPRYYDSSCSHTDAVWLQISAAYEALGYPPLDRTGVPESGPTE